MTATATPPRVDLGRDRERPSGRARGRNSLVGYLFLSPALILFVVFIGGPLVSAVILSFYDYDLLTPARYTGLSNFSKLFQDHVLYRALGNTLLFTLASLVTHLVGGMLLAVGVNSLKNRCLSYVVRTSIFFPFVISWAAVALIWKYVLDPTFGMGTYYLQKVGVDTPNWFLDPSWSLLTIIGIDFWHTIGYTFVIMLAGLQTVPKELGEAARTDGASTRQVFWHVTLPLMSPTIFFAAIVTFIGAFQIFDPMQILEPQGGPNNSTLSLVQYLYQKGFTAFQIGYASAVSLVIFVITMLVTAIQFWGSRRWVHET